jgi:CRISPR-associated Cas5-like protein
VTNHAASWQPPAGIDCEAQRVGSAWDAVRAPAEVGALVLAWLADDSGAVIEDAYSRTMYGLVTPGSADGWDPVPLRPAYVLRDTAHETYYLGVPPAHRTTGPGLHWRIPVSHDRYLTEPDPLRSALRAVASAAPETGACTRCAAETTELIRLPARPDHHGISRAARLCPTCAPDSLTETDAWGLVLDHATTCPTCHADRRCRTVDVLLTAHQAARRRAGTR